MHHNYDNDDDEDFESDFLSSCNDDDDDYSTSACAWNDDSSSEFNQWTDDEMLELSDCIAANAAMEVRQFRAHGMVLSDIDEHAPLQQQPSTMAMTPPLVLPTSTSLPHAALRGSGRRSSISAAVRGGGGGGGARSARGGGGGRGRGGKKAAVSAGGGGGHHHSFIVVSPPAPPARMTKKAAAAAAVAAAVPHVKPTTLTAQFRVNQEINLAGLAASPKRSSSSSATFRNSTSIEVSGPGLEQLKNVKATVFSNGIIKLTGCRTLEHCEIASNLVLGRLQSTNSTSSRPIVANPASLEIVRGRDGETMAVHMLKADGFMWPMCLYSAHAVLRRSFHDITFSPATYAGLQVRCNVATETVAGAKEPMVVLFRTGRVSVIARSEREMQAAFDQVQAALVAARAHLCPEAHKACPVFGASGGVVMVGAAAAGGGGGAGGGGVDFEQQHVADPVTLVTDLGKRKRNSFDQDTAAVAAPAAVIQRRIVRARTDML